MRNAESGQVPVAGVTLATALAALLAGAWVLLTAATGKTYHLAPLLAAAAPAAVVFTQGDGRLPPAWLVAAIGLAAAAAGWLVILAAGIKPTATFVPGQPGGVWLEVAGGGLFGAAVAGLLVAARR